ncbi:GNAT family N-acetyltransferase [Lottiidibacillus patelloidae]|uniref:GNAT family N-acetyltransferase n=1 Tax=Lottiidibacillus patelloidae TaxID=2670334 RepID=A0A263BPT7_9BACI|nr:GNAT family N-acetyltransferase [Lottiidibacillus patelloidae]OZM55775.1 GNAT family N-acetyltransferase [Lottiidibacillus patelloidae]
MITFEEITQESLYIAEEIINSNKSYNKMENGKETRSQKEVAQELNNNKTTSYFIKLDDTYIGLIDYFPVNPNDNYPWLGLLMIHADYQQFGFGSSAYVLFENQLQEKGVKTLRLGVLQENMRARQFWERLGFTFYETKEKHNKQIDCFEKKLTS